MISVEEALKIVIHACRDFGSESVKLENCLGKILDEDIVADRDFPPFNRVMMDGIAIAYEAYEKGRKSFKIESVSPAGSPINKLLDNENCIEVMTGAVLPEHSDTVIRYEDLKIKNGNAELLEGLQLQQFQNIHSQGRDHKANSTLIQSGKEVSTSVIAAAASTGYAQLLVKRMPSVLIISTGDELVDINSTPGPHQIRKSNVYQIKSVLSDWGINATIEHLNDDREEIHSKLSKFLESFDVIILCGAVSKGKFDFLPDVLNELGVEKLFHKIAQRPGKPFWFGNTSSCTIFAFPGNPISSFICLQRYFRSWLIACGLKQGDEQLYAILSEDVHFKPSLHYFLPVKLSLNPNGKLIAQPMKPSGSGDLVTLTRANAFIQLPSDREDFAKGDVFEIIPFR